MSSPELVFLHIPKTAGTSQRSAFHKHYGRDKVFWIGMDCPANVKRYPQQQVGDRFVVGGHQLLSFYPRHFDPLYCSILRDPVERAISLFGYYTRPGLARSEREKSTRSQVLEKMRNQGIEPDSMLLSIRNSDIFRQEISNGQCKYLSRGAATLAGARKSLRNLDHAIGTMNNHELFHRELGVLLGFPDEASVRVNRSQDNYLDPFLQDEELVETIRRLNTQDQLLLEWVEAEHQGLWLNFSDLSARQRRLRKLPLVPVEPKASKRRFEDAGELWPVRGQSKLKWPLSRMMVAQPNRLIYMPIPGAADPAVKSMMLQLASLPHCDEIRRFGIDRVVERFATGLVLDDFSQDEINSLGQSREYFRFAIVYHPVARLVDLYQQRFVQMRQFLPQWPQLHKLAADAQSVTEPDCELGISFRQFVEGCVSGRYNNHLLFPQARFLPWPDSYDRFYRPDQLPLLANDLAALRGVSFDLPELTVNRVPCGVSDAAYADTRAAELPEDSLHWREKLVDQPLLEMIQSFYIMDFKLYNRTAGITQEVALE